MRLRRSSEPDSQGLTRMVKPMLRGNALDRCAVLFGERCPGHHHRRDPLAGHEDQVPCVARRSRRPSGTQRPVTAAGSFPRRHRGSNQRDTLKTPVGVSARRNTCHAVAGVEPVLESVNAPAPVAAHVSISDIWRTSNFARRSRQVRTRFVVNQGDARVVRRSRQSPDNAPLSAPINDSLISTPVMRVLPAQMAVRMSRPPPTPITATSPLRRRYGREVTSYPTQSSDFGSPSHLVMTVPASPSIAAVASVVGV